MDNFERFNELELTPIEEFYSRLNYSNVSAQDYEHAQKVWKHFNIKNMGAYHDLYLKTDVILLADIFENFRDVCNENYELGPAWYYISPGRSWDALLKKTEIKLDLLSHADKILFVENGIRGGVCMISKRYGEGNNKYMKSYKPNEESKYIAYLDANNLYGWVMSQKFPYEDFERVDDKEEGNPKPEKIDLNGFFLF